MLIAPFLIFPGGGGGGDLSVGEILAYVSSFLDTTNALTYVAAIIIMYGAISLVRALVSRGD